MKKMKWLFNLISNNLSAGILIAFFLGTYLGGLAAWGIQDIRLHHLQTKYEDFMQQTQQEAQVARKLNAQIALENQKKKENADNDYQVEMDTLHTTIKRMQNARARSSFLPPITAGATNTDTACFKRGDLEQALQRLDNGIQGLITEGDEAITGLNKARNWVSAVY